MPLLSRQMLCQVTMDDGRITDIIGDKDNPVYYGYSCIRGRNYHNFHYAPDRITRPLKRSGDGSFEPISLHQSLDEITEKLRRIIDRHGSRSVAMYSGTFSHSCPSGVMTRQSFMDAIDSPMRFTNATIDQPGKPIAMALHGRWGAGPQPFNVSDVCLIVGANPLVSMWGGVPPFNPARRLHHARKRGLKLIVIDPRRSETAKKAELHLQCLPGFDPAILASMIHVIISERLHDTEFVREETRGFEALANAVKSFTPGRIAGAAGLAEDEIRSAARMFANADKGMATGGTGSGMAPHGVLLEYLILAINTLCGRWIRSGENIPNQGVLYRMHTGVARAEKPQPGWGFGEQLRVRGLTDTASGLPTSALSDEILTPGEGQVRALFVVGGNPLPNWPNREKVRRALESLELLVVVDPEMSATAQCADYVLGPSIGFELPATSFGSEGISFYGLSFGLQEPFGQYQPALIDPPEGSELIEDWRVFYELAKRMGLDLKYFKLQYNMEQPPTTDELLTEFLKKSPVPLEEVKKFPAGKLFESQSITANSREPDWPYRLDVGQADMLAELAMIDARLGSKSTLAESAGALNGLNLLLISRRLHEAYNSVAHQLPALKKKIPYNPVFMNPEDASTLGVCNGDSIELATAKATVSGIVELAEDLRQGVVSIAHGFPNSLSCEGSTDHPGTSTAALLDDEIDYDPISGLPVMSAVPVSVSVPSKYAHGQ